MLVNFLEILLLITPILGSKYDFTFEKLEIEPNPNSIANVEVTVKKKSESVFLVSGSLEQLVELDDTYDIQISLLYDPADSGSLKSLATLPRMGVCVMMKTLYKKLLYERLVNACENAPDPEQCPLPPRRYDVNNMEIDLNEFADIFLEGHYEVLIEVYKDNSLQVKYAIFGSTKEL